jgi:hypothetical protein
MVLQKGDYILLDYTIQTKDDGKVIETLLRRRLRRPISTTPPNLRTKANSAW